MAESILDLINTLLPIRAGSEAQSFDDGINVYPVYSSAELHRLLLIAESALLEDPSGTRYILDQNGVPITMTNSQFINLINTVLERNTKLAQAEYDVASQIYDLTITEFDDVYTAFSTAYGNADARPLLSYVSNLTELVGSDLPSNEMVTKVSGGFATETLGDFGKVVAACDIVDDLQDALALEMEHVAGLEDEINDLHSDIDGFIAQKSAASGLCPLDSGGKVPSAFLAASVMDYKGAWSASGNSPALANGTGNVGDVYRASTAGTVNFGAGNQTFAVGDLAIYNGSIWEHSPSNTGVTSVFGRTGVVVAANGDYTTAQVTESGNLYFTDERAQDAVGNILSADFVYNDAGNAIGLRAKSFANPSVSLNSSAKIDTTRDAMVSYSVDISCSMSLLAGQSGTAILEYADDSGFTTNVKTVARVTNSNSGVLTIGLALTQIGGGCLSGIIPANKYRRVRTVNNTSTPTFTMQNAQEVLL